jgi:hypothetical protein
VWKTRFDTEGTWLVAGSFVPASFEEPALRENAAPKARGSPRRPDSGEMWTGKPQRPAVEGYGERKT